MTRIVFVDGIVNSNGIRNTIQRYWKPRFGVSISGIDDSVFLFNFMSYKDIQRDWAAPPWTMMGSHLILQNWLAEARMGDYRFLALMVLRPRFWGASDYV